MNLPVKLALVAGAALAVVALLASAIYYVYLASPAASPVQTASVHRGGPPPRAAPSVPVSVDVRHDISPTVVPTNAPLLPTLVVAHEEPRATPTPVPPQPLILVPSRNPVNVAASPTSPVATPTPNASPVEAGQVAVSTSGKLQAPDPAPQTAGSGSDDQVQFTPKKEEQKYPNLGAHLNRLVASVESGQVTAEEAAQLAAIHQGDSVAVTIHLSGKADAVVRFLVDKGGDPRNVGEDYIEAYVPVTLLGAVSELPGVNRVREIIPPQTAGPSGGPARP